ncbi:MAG: hypothetical protein ACKOXF_09610 [Chitinophagaceae bacterium]
MKKIGIAFIGLIGMIGCVSNKAARVELPAMMSDSLKKVTMEQCNKGMALFIENCSSCHCDTSKKKLTIPDFSAEQLSNYEFRFANKKHEEQLSESQLSQDELVQIITFLTYKKKN